MLPDYHKILGVPRNATNEQIKKAYYHKVKLYHPDRNPSKAAHDQFILIHEAYDALLEGRTKRVEPIRRDKAADVKGTPQYYEKQYKARYKKVYKERGKRSNREYGKFIKNKTVGKIVSWLPTLPMVFFLFLLTDVLLPARIEQQIILEKVYDTRRYAVKVNTQDYNFYVPFHNQIDFVEMKPVKIHITRLLGVKTKAVLSDNNMAITYPLDNIYTTYWILLMGLFLFSAFGISSALGGRQNEMLVILIFLMLLLVVSVMYC